MFAFDVSVDTEDPSHWNWKQIYKHVTHLHIFTTDQDVKVLLSALLKINLVERITEAVA